MKNVEICFSDGISSEQIDGHKETLLRGDLQDIRF